MPKPGDTFDRYTLETELGAGGMGTVFRARDGRLERRVAIKVLADAAHGPDGNARLLREARAAAALDHPNAVAIFDVGEVEGAPYIVMEHVAGATLRTFIGDDTVPLAKRTAWLADVARALAAAHRRGLVHRDIKPENVMVRDDGLLKVLDFGIARRTSVEVDPTGSTVSPALPTLTREGVRMGTPAYMAPEQIRGEAVDGRIDQFAWAVLAYELYTGRVPWRGAGDALAAVASVLTDPVEEKPLIDAGVPAGVRAVILRALERDPAKRFASMDDALAALAAPAASAQPAQAAKAPAATLAQQYNTQEIKAVLTRALDEQAERKAENKLSFDELLAAAREVGIDEAALREASHDLRIEREAEAQRAAGNVERDAWLRRRKRGVVRHFGIFLIVQLAFFLLGIGVGHVGPLMIPGLFWAIGVAIHALTVMTANHDDWTELVARRQRREERRRRRGEVVDRALEARAAALLRTGDARRSRGRGAREEVAGRVRVAADSPVTPASAGPGSTEALADERPRDAARRRVE